MIHCTIINHMYTYIQHVYIYIYTYIVQSSRALWRWADWRLASITVPQRGTRRKGGSDRQISATVGWHHLSNVTCLTRPHSLHASLVVSRIVMMCYIIRQWWSTRVLDKWFPLNKSRLRKSRLSHLVSWFPDRPFRGPLWGTVNFATTPPRCSESDSFEFVQLTHLRII